MLFIQNLLIYILMFPIIGISLLLLVPSREIRLLKFIGLNAACSSFIGEFLILAGSFKVNTSVTLLEATGMVVWGAYSLWLFNRISYGNLKIQYTTQFLDVSFREFVIFLPLIIGTLFSGLYSDIFLSSIRLSVNHLIELLYF